MSYPCSAHGPHLQTSYELRSYARWMWSKIKKCLFCFFDLITFALFSFPRSPTSIELAWHLDSATRVAVRAALHFGKASFARSQIVAWKADAPPWLVPRPSGQMN